MIFQVYFFSICQKHIAKTVFNTITVLPSCYTTVKSYISVNPPATLNDNTNNKHIISVICIWAILCLVFLAFLDENTPRKMLEKAFLSVQVSKVYGGACLQNPLDARTFGAPLPRRLLFQYSLLLKNLLKALMLYHRTIFSIIQFKLQSLTSVSQLYHYLGYLLSTIRRGEEQGSKSPFSLYFLS